MTNTSGEQTPVIQSVNSKENLPENPTVPGGEPDHLVEIPMSRKNYVSVSIFCLMVAFGGFIFGWDTGTISGFVNMTDFLERFGERRKDGTYYMSNVRTGLLVSIFNIGCAFGGVFLARVGDMYGRRIGLMFSMIIYCVGVIVVICSTHKWYQVCVGRAVEGLAVGTVTVLSPLFISESAPKALRGTLVSCFQLCCTFGIFLGYCTTYGTKKLHGVRQWRIPMGLCFAWAAFLVAGMMAMPESARYLVEKGKIEEAKKSLSRTNKLSPEDPAVYTEVQLIQAGIEREHLAGSASWTELITGKPAIFRRVLMGIMLQSLQQLTGCNYFFYYGTTIFAAVGMKDSFETAIVFGIVNFASTFLGIYFIDRFGRRMCLLGGSAYMFCWFIMYSVIGAVHLYRDGKHDPNSSYKPSGDAMIFISCMYILGFASTWAGGVYTIVSETYPLRIRSKAMAIATAANWIWGFLIGFFTPFITSAIHFYYGFVFSGCLLFSFFYVYFFVNETKGLTLEEVDELYAQKVLPWKSANWVPPNMETMAHSTGFAAEAKPKTENV